MGCWRGGEIQPRPVLKAQRDDHDAAWKIVLAVHHTSHAFHRMTHRQRPDTDAQRTAVDRAHLGLQGIADQAPFPHQATFFKRALIRPGDAKAGALIRIQRIRPRARGRFFHDPHDADNARHHMPAANVAEQRLTVPIQLGGEDCRDQDDTRQQHGQRPA